MVDEDTATGTGQTTTRSSWAAAGILGLWAIVHLGFVTMAGNTVGGDAAVYAKAVEILHTTGRLVVPDWSTASIVFQVLWAGLFTKVAGFSFPVLAASALVINFVGALCFLALCRQLHARGPMAPLALALYLFNPLMLAVTAAHPFNTDAVFVSLATMALFLFERGVRLRSVAWTLAGAVVAAAATLVRQYAFLVAVAAALLWLLPWHELRMRRRIGLMVAAVAPAAVALVGYSWWLVNVNGVPTAFKTTSLELVNVPRIVWSVAAIPFFALMYGGLFFLPIVLPAFLATDARGRRRSLLHVGAVGVVAALVAAFAPEHHRWQRAMPYLPNTFAPGGLAWQIALTAGSALGAGFILARMTGWVGKVIRGWAAKHQVRGAQCALRILLFVAAVLGLLLLTNLAQPLAVAAGEWVIHFIQNRRGGAGTPGRWTARLPELYRELRLGLLLVMGLAMAVGLLVLRTLRLGARAGIDASSAGTEARVVEGSRDVSQLSLTLVGLCFAIFLALLIFLPTYFDRYLLALQTPGLLLLVTGASRVPIGRMATALAALVVLLGLGNGYPEMRHSRALWHGGAALMAAGIPARQIDAGPGFNYYQLYPQVPLRGAVTPNNGKPWWVLDDTYLVTETPPTLCRVSSAELFFDPLQLSKRTVVVCERR